MSIINVHDCEPGMVTEKPVFNCEGQLLLKENMIVTEKHISIFKKWGVLEVNIKGIDSNKIQKKMDQSFSESELRAIDQLLNERFLVPLNPISEEIKNVTKKILMEKILEEKMNSNES